LGLSRNEWFYAPVWHLQWRPARLRSILASAQLRTFAHDGLLDDELSSTVRDMPPPTALTAARQWLSTRGVAGVVRFPIERFGSDNAPERRAMRGSLVPTGGQGP
jgi:CRISPR-associated protein Csb3